MNCRAWEPLLNDHLDGGPADPLERHLRDCPHCAAHRAGLVRLVRGLDLLTPPAPPPGLASRIASAVADDRRRRLRGLRRWMPYAALAAACLLLAVVGLRTGRQPDVAGRPVASGPALRESVSRASQAVATLTARTATATVEETARLIPSMDTLPIESPPQPALEPIREATEEVSTRLAPVADSARRAVNLFFRDLPMARTSNNPG